MEMIQSISIPYPEQIQYTEHSCREQAARKGNGVRPIATRGAPMTAAGGAARPPQTRAGGGSASFISSYSCYRQAETIRANSLFCRLLYRPKIYEMKRLPVSRTTFASDDAIPFSANPRRLELVASRTGALLPLIGEGIFDQYNHNHQVL